MGVWGSSNWWECVGTCHNNRKSGVTLHLTAVFGNTHTHTYSLAQTHRHSKPQTHTFTPNPSGRVPVSHYGVCEKTPTKAVYSPELCFTVVKRVTELSSDTITEECRVSHNRIKRFRFVQGLFTQK